MLELRAKSYELRETEALPLRLGKLVTRRSKLDARGLTLVELLVSITILATLAALFLGVSNSAMESARRARTKTTIAKIHTLLMERWDEYTTRRADVNPIIENDIRSSFPDPTLRGQAMADARLLALRELIKLELPDRWSDIIGDTVDNVPPTTPISALPNLAFLDNRPTISNIYYRKYQRLKPSATEKSIADNQSAECLYMIIMLYTGDGEARTLFSRQDIGDTDDDGAPEFLDGWGRPIHFVRWPAGFVSRSELMSGDASVDHDPYDPFHRDDPNAHRPSSSSYPTYLTNWIKQLENVDPAFRLVPLIYSGGPDGDPDLFTAKLSVIGDPYSKYTSNGITTLMAAPLTSGGNPEIDPSDDGDNFLDNIHNHVQDGG